MPADKLSEFKSSGTAPGFIRDKDCYHESGDCVVLVGETLFKIHRYRLASDGSAFGGMFSLPSGEKCPNSTTEDEPLILQDSAEEFRALCWALYALPFEIDALNHTAAFMPKFKCVLNLFSISHKYHFDSLEVWAKHLLEHHCTSCNNTDSKHPVLDSPSICEADLELMLRLSIRTNLNSLLEVAVNALMRRLKDHFIFCSIAHNMELAEELGMQKFQGRLYYHELLRQEAVTKAIHASTAYSTQTSDLTEKQYSALFRGYWSLMHYWRDLPPIVRNKPLPPLTSCTGHETCETEWKKLWNEDNFKLKLDPSPHDLGPLEKLENIRSLKDRHGEAMSLCGVSELDQIIKQLKDTLGDHFLGPQA